MVSLVRTENGAAHTFGRQILLQYDRLSPQDKASRYCGKLYVGDELSPVKSGEQWQLTWADRASPNSVSFAEQPGARLLRIGVS